MQRVLKNEQDIAQLARQVLARVQGVSLDTAVVLALRGDLGAGKTTFTKALAKELGIEEHVTSPTFVIQKLYPIHKPSDGLCWQRLVHIDAYRFESAADAAVLNLSETLADPKNLVVIEWPENIAGALPESAITITFDYCEADAEKRTATIDDSLRVV